MKNMKHLLAGFVVGIVMAIAPSCGTAKNCTPTNCSSGCCNDKGSCELGTSNGACGHLGGTCSACSFGQACNLGSCVATSGNGGGGGSNGGGSGGGGVTGGGAGGGVTGGGTGGGVTGGGSGGGVTGGGSGGGVTGGGGGTACDGCVAGGNTCINFANANNATFCGQGGVACVACPLPGNCVNHTCVGGTGGGGGGGATGGGTGGGVTGGGGGTALQPIGGPCASSMNCQSGLACKTATQVGTSPYPGGYCTKACAQPTDCPAGAECIGGPQSSLQFYGEPSGFCAAICPSAGSQGPCRNGYTCEFNAAGMPGNCWLNPIPNFNGGGIASNTGAACTTDTCQPSGVSSLLSFCFKGVPRDGGTAPTGFPGGYCSADCSYDNLNTFCGTNGTCIQFNGGTANEYFGCLAKCPTPGAPLTGNGCRTGYACIGVGLPDGGSSGACYRSCASAGATPCASPAPTCNSSTGLCQ